MSVSTQTQPYSFSPIIFFFRAKMNYFMFPVAILAVLLPLATAIDTPYIRSAYGITEVAHNLETVTALNSYGEF